VGDENNPPTFAAKALKKLKEAFGFFRRENSGGFIKDEPFNIAKKQRENRGFLTLAYGERFGQGVQRKIYMPLVRFFFDRFL